MKKLTITIVGWLISIALIVGLAMKLDWRTIWASLIKANIWWILLAATASIVVLFMRALRWQWIMRTQKKAHYSTIFKATTISQAGNCVLPARGGDWYRIYLLGKWEKVSHAALASMTGIDKLFDGLAILGLFAIASLQSTFPEWVRRGTLVVTGVIIGSLIVCILLRIHHRKSVDVHPQKMGRIRHLIYNLGAGMSILEEKRLFGATLLLSIAIAILQITALFATQYAFDIILPFYVPVLVFVAINLAITIPSAPSGIGPFEVAAVLAYTWQGLSKEVAFNIALIYHAVQVIPIVLIGAYIYATTFRHEHPEKI